MLATSGLLSSSVSPRRGLEAEATRQGIGRFEPHISDFCANPSRLFCANDICLAHGRFQCARRLRIDY
jgi:hypothetical protein